MSSYHGASGNFLSATVTGITIGSTSVFMDGFVRSDPGLSPGSTSVFICLSNAGTFGTAPLLRMQQDASRVLAVTSNGGATTGAALTTAWRYVACLAEPYDGGFHNLLLWEGSTQYSTSKAPASTALSLGLLRIGQDFTANAQSRAWEEQQSIILGLNATQAAAQVAARMAGAKVLADGVFTSASTSITGTFVVGDNGKPIRCYGAAAADIHDTTMTYVDATHATLAVAFPFTTVASGGLYQIGKQVPLGDASLPQTPAFSWDLRADGAARNGGVDLTTNGTVTFSGTQIPFLSDLSGGGGGATRRRSAIMIC